MSVKFIYSEKATIDLSYVLPVKSKVEILQKFVAHSEYMNFKLENSGSYTRPTVSCKLCMLQDKGVLTFKKISNYVI